MTTTRPLSQPFDASHVATLLNLQEQGERELERALTLVVNGFIEAVTRDVLQTLTHPAPDSITAAATPTGWVPLQERRVSDPFAYTTVMRRWREAIQTLYTDHLPTLERWEVDPQNVEQLLTDSGLPNHLYEDVQVILDNAAAEAWTENQTKRALSKLLIPKQKSSKTTPASQRETRDEYRARVRSTAIETINQNLQRATARRIQEQGLSWKKWVAHHDDRTRPAHREADGQTVPATDTFTVGGFRMRYPKDPSAPLHLTINCRCIMVGAKKKGDNLNGITNEELTSITASATPTDETDTPTHGIDPMPWVGVLALEGHPTGDGRTLAADSLSWSTPLPLRWVKQDTGEHNGAVVVGKILTIDRVPHPNNPNVNIIKASGVFAETPEGYEAQNQVAEELAQGVSVDLDDMQFTFADGDNTDDNGPRDVTITKARIRAATLVAIPAFAEAKLQVLTDNSTTDDEETDEEKATFDAIAETWENSNTDGDTAGGEDLGTFNWVSDAGGLPHYIDRIRKALQRRGMPKSHAIASAVNQVKRWARGGGKVTAKTRAKAVKALAEWEAKRAAAHAKPNKHSASTDTFDALVASAAPVHPPAQWFNDPHLDGPTGITVTEEGRIYGHLALWDTCHIASGPGQCTTAPHSQTDYAYFHTGAILTDDSQELAVGHLTLGTGHAAPDKTVRGTMAHYDNTGLAVADVRAGEDSYGIWVAGAVRPHISPEDIRTLRSSPLSGDWRRVQGNLELVAALAVNVPGFPVPRTKGATKNKSMYSLVAAGVIPPAPSEPEEEPDTPPTAQPAPSALDRKAMTYARGLYLEKLNTEAQAHRATLRKAKLDKLGAVKASLTPPPSPTH
nr:MAG TPA: minor head component F [Caudoviricetes sp.]